VKFLKAVGLLVLCICALLALYVLFVGMFGGKL